MNLFNEINCRKIHEHGKLLIKSHYFIDFNVFDNFFNNPLFLFVVIVTFVVQILLVQFGGEAVKCSRLTVEQHLYCIILGFFSLLVGIMVKFLPVSLF